MLNYVGKLADNCMVDLEMNQAMEPFLDTKEHKNNDKILEAALAQAQPNKRL